MTPSFSPFLAHLLMTGLARRALQRSDAWCDAPGAEAPAQAPLLDAAEAAAPSAASSIDAAAAR